LLILGSFTSYSSISVLFFLHLLSKAYLAFFYKYLL
jgi:hypothetical protein